MVGRKSGNAGGATLVNGPFSARKDTRRAGRSQPRAVVMMARASSWIRAR
jgi:hypothetical protein